MCQIACPKGASRACFKNALDDRLPPASGAIRPRKSPWKLSLLACTHPTRSEADNVDSEGAHQTAHDNARICRILRHGRRRPGSGPARVECKNGVTDRRNSDVRVAYEPVWDSVRCSRCIQSISRRSRIVWGYSSARDLKGIHGQSQAAFFRGDH